MTPEVIYLERAAEARRNIPKVIRLLLAVTGHPARHLADALGMSETSLSERLNGKTRITGEQLAVCALFFGVEEGTFYRNPDSFRRQILGQSSELVNLPTGRSTEQVRAGAKRAPEARVA